jgi:hypothetical protein
MSSLHRRLEALEKQLGEATITLHMPDGSKVQLPGSAMKLLGGAMRGDASPEQQRMLDLIARSTESVESDGGHMIELMRAIMLSPREEENRESLHPAKEPPCSRYGVH